jgi:hypothetical protein
MKKIVVFILLSLSSFGAVAAHADPGPAAHTYWQQETLRSQHKYNAAARYDTNSSEPDFMAYTAPER